MASLPDCISQVFEKELAHDISEGCFVQGLTLEAIAAEENVEGLANKLFLTKDESNCFVMVCRGSIKGLEKPTGHHDNEDQGQCDEDPQSLRKVDDEVVALKAQELPAILSPEPSEPPALVLRKTGRVNQPMSTSTTSIPAAHLARSFVSPDLSRSTCIFTSMAYKMNPNGNLARSYASMSDAKLRCSLQTDSLSALLNQPQGQRVTRPTPFNLGASLGSKDARHTQMSTEEMALADAQAHTFKPLPLRKQIFEPRPLEYRVSSSPRDPKELFKPFNLSSLDRHAKCQEKWQGLLTHQHEVEQQDREFKARTFDKSIAEGVKTPTKPAPKACTVPTPPSLMSDQRGQFHKTVLTPSKLAKIAALEKARDERRKKEVADEQAAASLKHEVEEKERVEAEEIEKQAVTEHRKTLNFNARQMPDFSSPFRPDLQMSKAVTVNEGFNLKTDERLGPAQSMSVGAQERVHYDHGGNMCLRKSASTAHPLSMSGEFNGLMSLSALRRSTNTLSLVAEAPTLWALMKRSIAMSPRGAVAQRAAQTAKELRKALSDAIGAVGLSPNN
eukprot:gene9951-7822_t